MKINDIIGDATKIGIVGHIRPDGDAIGSCMSLYNYLKKQYKFKYKSIWHNLFKVIIATIIMTLLIVSLNGIINIEVTGRIALTIKVMIYGIFGAIVYAIIMYLNNGFNEIFGKDIVNKILKKLHLKRS